MPTTGLGAGRGDGEVVAGELKSQIDAIWNPFWSGGISNPLEVMEQITYLLFIKRLDDLQTFEEHKASRLGEPLARTIFPAGRYDKGSASDMAAPPS